MSDMFGELPKGHKSLTKCGWNYQGLITDNFEQLYDRYISITHCEKCGNVWKNRTDRCMDHDHSTGQFRNFLCRACNNRTDVKLRIDNTCGYKSIYTNVYKNGATYWVIDMVINGKRYQKKLNKKKFSLEEAVFYRDAMIDDLTNL